MKQSLLLFFILSAGITHSQSKKGNWSKEDLVKARYELNSEREGMEALIGKEQTDLFIECAMEKIETQYKGFEEADSDLSGMEKIGEECMTDLLDAGISVRGNWSEADVEKTLTGLNEERGELDDLIGKDQTDIFIQCVLEKMEEKYPNFESAEKDASGVEKIATECVESVMNSEDINK